MLDRKAENIPEVHAFSQVLGCVRDGSGISVVPADEVQVLVVYDDRIRIGIQRRDQPCVRTVRRLSFLRDFRRVETNDKQISIRGPASQNPLVNITCQLKIGCRF